ncbi:hypothetical protein SAMN05444170_4570 [Bradyrhizobium erythrophlei]|uniref:Uncharacterized protein n=1 Tax=Bradyrhizobium erythrophlei TaxID=1437360 RepID=A0A1M7UDI3_9BRAD|nr:hypothetical protein SAMN05444170_4570 [Bradyrhizobium erythrophlei]
MLALAFYESPEVLTGAQRLIQRGIEFDEAADRQLASALRLDCLAWSALQFTGGPEAPSPTIAAALQGGVELLEVQFRQCNHTELIDLALVIWPRERPIHTLRRALYCAKCLKNYQRKRRPDLIGLRVRQNPDPTSPMK